jgi:NADH dehydrogenase
MTIQNICLFGGTGFVGKSLISRLIANGYHVKVLTRHRHRHQNLSVIPRLTLTECSLSDPTQIERELHGFDTAINLVGILNEFSDDGFVKAHVTLTENIIAACQANGVHRFLHMSALHADENGLSRYLQTKGQAENYVHSAHRENLAVTSFRPSVIFGHGDSFLNRFADLLRQIPVAFPLACAHTRFAPVFVGDVADAFVTALENPTSFNKRINLCGPRTYTLHELVKYIADTINVKRTIVDLPDWASKLQATIMGMMPGKPFTRDNYLSLQIDSVCDSQEKSCPTRIESIASSYLGNTSPAAKLDTIRKRPSNPP